MTNLVFSAKLMPKLVCLTNAVVLDNVFSFKSLFLSPFFFSHFILRIIKSPIAVVMDNDIWQF